MKTLCTHFLQAICVCCLLLLSAGRPEAQTPTPSRLRVEAVAAGPDTARLVAQTGHYSMIRDVAFSPNGRYALTASHDGTARLWDVATNCELRQFINPDGPLQCALFSPDGQYVLTGSEQGAVLLWEMTTGRQIRAFVGHRTTVDSAKFSRDGRLLLTGSYDKTARLWDVASGKEIRKFEGHSKEVVAVALSPDERFIVTGGWDQTARLWDRATGKELHRVTNATKSFNSVAFTPGGRYFVTGSDDKTVRFWEVTTGKEAGGLSLKNGSPMSLQFSSDGRTLVTANWDNTASILDVPTGKEIHSLVGHTDIVTSAALSPDGHTIVTGSWDNTARLWDVKTGKEIGLLAGRTLPLSVVAFSPNTRYVLTGLQDKTVHVWDAVLGRQRSPLVGHKDWINAAVFAPDNRFVLTGSTDKTARLWDVTTSREIYRLVDSAAIYAVAFAPNGRTLLTANANGKIQLWDRTTGKALRSCAGGKDVVRSVIFSSDSRYVLAGGDARTAWMWDTTTGKLLHTFSGHKDGLNAVVFSPNGHYVLTAGNDKTTRLWDRATGRELHRCTTTDFITTVSFTPDGKRFLTASVNGVIGQWDTATGKEIHRADSHAQWYEYVAINLSGFVTFSANGRYVMAGSWDESAHIYDVTTGHELCRMVTFHDGSWAVSDPVGRFDASRTGDLDGLHWVVSNQPIALSQLKERYYEPGLLSRCLGFRRQAPRSVEAFGKVPLFPDVVMRPIDAARLAITLTDQGGGIGKTQVYVNDVLYLEDARPPGSSSDAHILTFTVDITKAPTFHPGGRNQVRFVAFNAPNWLPSRGVQLVSDAGETAKPVIRHLYAIVCGISDYRAPELRLIFAARDAEVFARAIMLAGARLFGADKVAVTLLSSSGAPGTRLPTKEALHKAFTEVRAIATPDDILLVYFAGHGLALANDNSLYCYLTQDAVTTDMSKLAADTNLREQMSVSSLELADWMSGENGIKAQYRVMILDTCAAGAANSVLMNLNIKRDVPGDQVRAMERFKDRTGFHLLMGCAADKVSYESSRFGQGVLTYALLQGMKGAALREGNLVDILTLFAYAEETVPKLAGEIGGLQQPRYQKPEAGSFDIGKLSSEDRAKILLAVSRPQILRPKLSNKADGSDDLDLEKLLRKQLLDTFYLASRSVSERMPKDMVYVDAEELTGALHPVGQYTVMGKTVQVIMTLRHDKQLVGKPIIVSGTTANISALVAKVAASLAATAQNTGK